MATTRKKKASRSRRSGSGATIRLDRTFYSLDALNKAREAFAHLADIQLSKEGKWQVVRFSKMSAAAAGRLPDEFTNYALSCKVTG
jgi:hypothetical protein